MYEKQVKVTNDLGTRSAAELVKAAMSFEADITLTYNGKSASAKSLFKVQSLGISSGDTINISADGPQAQQAINHLVALLFY